MVISFSLSVLTLMQIFSPFAHVRALLNWLFSKNRLPVESTDFPGCTEGGPPNGSRQAYQSEFLIQPFQPCLGSHLPAIQMSAYWVSGRSSLSLTLSPLPHRPSVSFHNSTLKHLAALTHQCEVWHKSEVWCSLAALMGSALLFVQAHVWLKSVTILWSDCIGFDVFSFLVRRKRNIYSCCCILIMVYFSRIHFFSILKKCQMLYMGIKTIEVQFTLKMWKNLHFQNQVDGGLPKCLAEHLG